MKPQSIIRRLAAFALLACISLATSLAQGQTIIRQDTFENLTSAYDDWHANSGGWQMGKPTSRPGKACRGTNCAATVLAGN